jgi:hypothetical protein
MTWEMSVGEELAFALEPTLPPRWSEQPSAWRAEVGMVLRLELEARRDGWGKPWYLTCQIDLAGESRTVEVP